MSDVDIEPGKCWTILGEWTDEISSSDPLHAGDYLRRRELLDGPSPNTCHRRRRKKLLRLAGVIRRRRRRRARRRPLREAGVEQT